MMASRVTLLLLVTALFAGMWSGDRADEQSANARRLARKVGSSSVALQSNVRPIRLFMIQPFISSISAGCCVNTLPVFYIF